LLPRLTNDDLREISNADSERAAMSIMEAREICFADQAQARRKQR